MAANRSAVTGLAVAGGRVIAAGADGTDTGAVLLNTESLARVATIGRSATRLSAVAGGDTPGGFLETTVDNINGDGSPTVHMRRLGRRHLIEPACAPTAANAHWPSRTGAPGTATPYRCHWSLTGGSRRPA